MRDQASLQDKHQYDQIPARTAITISLIKLIASAFFERLFPFNFTLSLNRTSTRSCTLGTIVLRAPHFRAAPLRAFLLRTIFLSIRLRYVDQLFGNRQNILTDRCCSQESDLAQNGDSKSTGLGGSAGTDTAKTRTHIERHRARNQSFIHFNQDSVEGTKQTTPQNFSRGCISKNSV